MQEGGVYLERTGCCSSRFHIDSWEFFDLTLFWKLDTFLSQFSILSYYFLSKPLFILVLTTFYCSTNWFLILKLHFGSNYLLFLLRTDFCSSSSHLDSWKLFDSAHSLKHSALPTNDSAVFPLYSALFDKHSALVKFW